MICSVPYHGLNWVGSSSCWPTSLPVFFYWSIPVFSIIIFPTQFSFPCRHSKGGEHQKGKREHFILSLLLPPLRVPNRFSGIRDFPSLKLGIRDFTAKSGRDSGLKVCAGGGMPKIALGITGLLEILGRDYGIEEPYWGPSPLSLPVLRLPRWLHVHSMTYFCFKVWLNGQQKRATCFATYCSNTC